MRDVSDLVGLFLIALSQAIIHLPVGLRRVRGLVGMIVALSAFGPFFVWHIPAPIDGTVEFILAILFIGIIMVFGLRDWWGAPQAGPDANAKQLQHRDVEAPGP